MMGDDLNEQLISNKLQLQQVEASLELEPEKEELLTLRNQLLEVITLTCDLLGKNVDDVLYADKCPFKVGELVMAMSSTDRHYYRAVIESVLPDGTCQVIFSSLNTTDVCPITLLKPYQEASQTKPKKKRKAKDDKYRLEESKQKNLKRLTRIQDIETKCEQEKQCWQSFNKKMKKQGKLQRHRSIFASPDTVDGKVGVGTCGTGGKPMTAFSTRKNYLNN